MKSSLCLITSAALASGCASSSPPESTAEAELQIEVAPLDLEGVGDACYTLQVVSGLGQTVFTETGVCSDRFGNGLGAITYVGTCDASPGAENHTVYLTIESISDTEGTPLNDFVNPSVPVPLSRPALCGPNADTRVDFDITVMRRAQQGFFDVAVDFDDIFCSAKVDCADANGDPLELLFAPTGEARVPTVVVALACTGGLDADTHLYMSNLVLDCAGVDLSLALAGAEGNRYDQVTPAPAPLVQLATYRGLESLTDAEGTSWGKVFHNVALALDLDGGTAVDCRLGFSATASDGPLDACTTPDAATWPVLRYDVRLTTVGDAYTCTQHPLDATPDDDVHTSYVTSSTTFMAEVEADAGDPSGVSVTACVAPPPAGNRLVGIVYGESLGSANEGVYDPGDPTDPSSDKPYADYFEVYGLGTPDPLPSLTLSSATTGFSTTFSTRGPFQIDGVPAGADYCLTWSNPYGGGAFSGYWPTEPAIERPEFEIAWDGSPITRCGLVVTDVATTTANLGMYFSD